MAETTRKRILLLGYLPPPYFGPSITYQALLHSEFARHFDVTFVNLTVALQIGDLEKMHWGKILRFLLILAREFRWLTRRRFDYCCAPVSVNRNAFLKDALLLAIARAYKVPTVVYAHGNNLPDFYQRATPWVRRIINSTMRNATGAIVLGERLRFNFDPWLPADRICVVPTGIEPSTPTPATSPRNHLTVLYLGNLIREKGVFVLLEAARQIQLKRADARFVFAGAWFRAADEDDARTFVAEHNLSDCVQFAGPVAGEAKSRLLAGADILAFPTFYYYETMGLVLLEAMQAGLPVVATRRASIPEIIQDGVNGLLVEEQDATDLAEKILRLANDPPLRAQMGAANRERFAACYTHEQYGQRMIEALEQLDRRG